MTENQTPVMDNTTLDLQVFDINGDKACQRYVEQLSRVPKEALDAAGTKIVVIGCGEWNPIKSYAETAKFNGPFFTDPTRKIYHALGMTESLERTPKGQPKPSYISPSIVLATMLSIWRGPVKSPSHIGKNGNIAQNGGEFIFGPGPQCTFASRMKHTEDHVEVSELMKQAGVAFS